MRVSPEKSFVFKTLKSQILFQKFLKALDNFSKGPEHHET